ncbi:transglutaminase domain-containing protein [Paenibacillus sp. 19GGS1-52]|uniref:transglutaminase TgpA family protein n=1 Tax=Paenibacillus sp. 19GGS1-52 TaxID=2758563 RepID=UPI001EFC0D0B|nr:transglutaminase domain-containing protein [Paenibacillus sp. 19GGS1-52]ULO06951.1 transglutaminase domain-containing protein [Paenibacillus sp. 19GGS1-52]
MGYPGNQLYGSRIQSAGEMQSSLPIENSPVGKQGESPLYYRLLFSLPIMGLFIQWLLPLYRSTSQADTAQLLVTLIISALVLLLWGMFQLPAWLLLSNQILIITLTWFYICAAKEGIGWVNSYLAGITNDAISLLSGQVSQLSGDSRQLILIVGWGLLVCSVQQLALYRGSTLLFTVLTMVYLLVLDMGFGLNTTMNIIISLGLIVWMQAMSRLLHLRERTHSNRIPYARWGGLALSAAVAVTTTAWLGEQLYGSRPVAPISLQSAFSSLQEWTSGHLPERVEGLQTGTTGYSSDGGELGVPLSRSTEPVFTAVSSVPTYWRGESMAYYDGRRWIKAAEEYIPLNLSSLLMKGTSVEGIEGERTLVQRIQFVVPSSGGLPLFNAGTIKDVLAVQLADGSRLGYVLANKGEESFRLPDLTGSARVTEYTVKALLPESNPAVLRTLNGYDPQAITSEYLELPASLPRRIASLAEQLTAPAENRYDASVAVRDYLRSRYSYTLNTLIPPSGTDFVDNFLFDTRQGYCVHFATAMTILLRSAGIPARYVQGYGPGTLEAGSEPQRYAVTQGDAHAWVEVYFAGAGWVPFDPTPGAGGASGFAPPALPAAASAAPPSATPPAARARGGLPALPQAGGAATAPLAAALLLPAAAWRWRRSLALLLAAHSSRAGSRERQLRAASLAWHGLAARYGPPPPGATGREYVASLPIEDAGLHAAVRQFVRRYEALAYSKGRVAAVSDPAAFMRECLAITFRLS